MGKVMRPESEIVFQQYALKLDEIRFGDSSGGDERIEAIFPGFVHLLSV